VEDEWERPYTTGTGRRLVIGWEAGALGLFGWSSVQHFGLAGPGISLLVVALTALWIGGGRRIIQMGVYVGPRGLRVRGLLRTRTMSWEDIAHVRLHQQVHKLGGWRIDSGMTVLIERRDGSTVNTELWAQGVDFHSRPGAFREVYHLLRDRHLAAARA
jgi:hypothetical protein